jgi:hypothetical protein
MLEWNLQQDDDDEAEEGTGDDDREWDEGDDGFHG